MKAFYLLFLCLVGYFAPGATNNAAAFSGDVENFIQEKTLPLARRQLIAYQFGEMLSLDTNRGTTYTASRYTRLPLPYAPLQEGVAPAGEAMSLVQVSATAQQWGDSVTISDVANLTIKHPLFKQACELVALQISETLERNTFNSLMAGAQVNFANGKTSRANLVATDIMTSTEVYKIVGSLLTYGAPRFMGDENEDMMIEADAYRDPSKSPAVMPHYVGLVHPLVAQDMRKDSVVVNAWSYSDVNRLYNNELGPFGGVRFVESNMVPFFTGVAAISGTATSSPVGTFSAGSYFVQVTASPALTSVEQQIYQVSGSITLTANQSINVTLPNLPGYVFNVYVGTTASPTNLGLCSLGPTTGTLAGQATQLTGNQTVNITGTGTAQTPPAAPATGVTVYPTFFIGNHAYGQVILENPEFHYLTGADKSDKLNQQRVVSWKLYYGTILLNQGFFARTESGSGFSASYSSGTVTS